VDKNAELIHAAGDPQVGNLATPINSSPLSKAFLNNLPAYRQGLSASRRGLEIGLAHGYFLFGPFFALGPLRNTDVAPLAGLLSTLGLVAILTIALSIYGEVGVGKITPTLTNPKPPTDLETKEGWSEFTGSFLLGACGGAFFAYFLNQTPYLTGLFN
jgi:photosystem I subunit 11